MGKYNPSESFSDFIPFCGNRNVVMSVEERSSGRWQSECIGASIHVTRSADWGHDGLGGESMIPTIMSGSGSSASAI